MQKTRPKKRIAPEETDIRQRHYKRQKRKRARRVFFRSLFLFLLLTGCLLSIMFLTPLFKIMSVEVTGNAHVATQAIEDAAGIYQGDNIFKVSIKDTRERVGYVPYIRQAEVRRKLPGTVVIHVAESSLKAYIPLAAGYVGIDERGVVLEVFDASPQGVIKIEGLSLTEFKPAHKIVVDDSSKFDIILSCIKEFDASELTNKITELNVENKFDIRFTYDSRLVALCGDDSRFERKLAMFKEVCVNKLPENATGQVNLTVEGKAFYRP